MTKAIKNYRVAVIGCGKIGALLESEPRREKPASHAGAVMANKKSVLAAFVDTDARNLASSRRLFPHAEGYRSIAECLKTENPDIVIIATPPSARLNPLKECARFRIPVVICEKPFARSVKEAKLMKALVEKSGMTFVLNYHRRFSPLFNRVRAAIAKRNIGTIQQVTCYYSNGLFNNAGHTLDALEYLLNDPFVSVVALRSTLNKTFPSGDMNADAMLTTKNGVTVVLQSFDQNKYGIHDFHIFGTKGSIDIIDYGVTMTETPAAPSRFAGVKQLDNSHALISRVPLSATKGVLAHAIECYEKRRSPHSSIHNGVSVLKALEAIVMSAKRGGKKILF